MTREIERGTYDVDVAPRGKDSSSTRARILEVAGRLFVEKGFEATSVRDIAAELDIANPSLYYHFKSKAEILDELLASSLREVQGSIAAAMALDGEDRLRQIVGALVDSLKVGNGIAATMLREGGVPSEYAERARSMRPPLVALLGDSVPEDDRELRIAMATGAMEAAVRALMQDAPEGATFVARLDDRRELLVETILRVLS